MGTEFSAPIIFYVIQFIYIFVWWGLGSHRKNERFNKTKRAQQSHAPYNQTIKFYQSRVGACVKSNILYSLCKNILYSFSEWSSRGSSLIRYIFLNSKTLLSMLILPILNCLKNKLTQLSI